MGSLATFPFFQPEQYSFELDLSLYEDRMATSLVVSLASRERMENIRKPVLKLPNGVERPFEKGVPPSWTSLEAVPTSGCLTFKYVCSPEDRNMQMRVQLAEKYGGWENKPTAENVLWWSAATEASEAVLTFLYYMLNDFKDVFECFKKIDGPGGDGEVSHFDLKNVVHVFGWHKFQENAELVRGVFSFLDPDQGGTITLQEWAALDQLSKELQLSVLEFLKHVDRTFDGDIDRAWQELDEDGSGAIDQQEWGNAVHMLGYFGAADPVFGFITASSREEDSPDCITEEGWEHLKEVWERREEMYRKILRAG